MIDVLVLDRGKGKTSRVLEEAIIAGTNVVIVVPDEMAADHVFDLLARSGFSHVNRHQRIVSSTNPLMGQISVVTARRLRDGAARGAGPNAMLIVDDADRMEEGIYNPDFAPFHKIFATASPDPRRLVDLEATQRELRKVWRMQRRWQAEQDEKAGTMALVHLATKGHRVEGIDPERFGSLLRRWPVS